MLSTSLSGWYWLDMLSVTEVHSTVPLVHWMPSVDCWTSCLSRTLSRSTSTMPWASLSQSRSLFTGTLSVRSDWCVTTWWSLALVRVHASVACSRACFDRLPATHPRAPGARSTVTSLCPACSNSSMFLCKCPSAAHAGPQWCHLAAWISFPTLPHRTPATVQWPTPARWQRRRRHRCHRQQPSCSSSSSSIGMKTSDRRPTNRRRRRRRTLRIRQVAPPCGRGRVRTSATAAVATTSRRRRRSRTWSSHIDRSWCIWSRAWAAATATPWRWSSAAAVCRAACRTWSLAVTRCPSATASSMCSAPSTAARLTSASFSRLSTITWRAPYTAPCWRGAEAVTVSVDYLSHCSGSFSRCLTASRPSRYFSRWVRVPMLEFSSLNTRRGLNIRIFI